MKHFEDLTRVEAEHDNGMTVVLAVAKPRRKCLRARASLVANGLL